jgi:hypothetical protein
MMQSSYQNTDRTPIWFGCGGCGCGVLLAAFALAVLVTVTASTGGTLPVVKPDPSRPDIIITVQDAFIQQAIVRSVPGGALKDVKVNLQTGGVIAIQGRVEATLLGQTLSAPFSLAIRVAAQNGRLRVEVSQVEVAGNEAVSAALQVTLEGLGDQASQMINKQLIAGLGSNAYIMDVTTDDRQMIVRARWTGP